MQCTFCAFSQGKGNRDSHYDLACTSGLAWRTRAAHGDAEQRSALERPGRGHLESLRQCLKWDARPCLNMARRPASFTSTLLGGFWKGPPNLAALACHGWLGGGLAVLSLVPGHDSPVRSIVCGSLSRLPSSLARLSAGPECDDLYQSSPAVRKPPGLSKTSDDSASSDAGKQKNDARCGSQSDKSGRPSPSGNGKPPQLQCGFIGEDGRIGLFWERCIQSVDAISSRTATSSPSQGFWIADGSDSVNHQTAH
jgi:hypothetical protein